MKKKYSYEETARDRRDKQSRDRIESVSIDSGIRAKNREFLKKLLIFALIGILAISAGTAGIVLLSIYKYRGDLPVAEIKLETQGKKYTLVYQLFSGENEQPLAAGLFIQSAQNKIYNETIVSQVTKDMLIGGKYTEYTGIVNTNRFLESAYYGKIFEVNKNSEMFNANLTTFGYLSIASKDGWSNYFTPEFQICVRDMSRPAGSNQGIVIGFAYDDDTLAQLSELMTTVTVDDTYNIPDNKITIISVKIFNTGKEYRNYNINDHFEATDIRQYS